MKELGDAVLLKNLEGKREVQKEDSWAACCFWVIQECELPLSAAIQLLFLRSVFVEERLDDVWACALVNCLNNEG